MRQPSEDRSLYYRQLRNSIREVMYPELTSARARDTAGIVDRILGQFIVEEEAAPALSAEFGERFRALLSLAGEDPVTAPQFHALRQSAAAAVSQACQVRDQEQCNLVNQLIQVERDFLERVESLRAGVLAEKGDPGDAGPPEALSVTKDQLNAYLRQRLPDSPDVAVEDLELVPGGRSKETILVRLKGTNELPPKVILRKDRPVGLLQTKAADEFEILKAVYDYGGVPVPRPYFAEAEGHGLGEGTFQLMECVPGAKAGEYFPDLAAPALHCKEIAAQMAASLARLHTLPLDRLGRTGLDAEGSTVTVESVTATITGFVARIDELTGPASAAVPLAHCWLLDHVADVVPSPRLCLLQGDFGFHNMLVDHGRLTALVDWEGAAIGPPAREMAAAWNSATALVPWPDFVRDYVAAGGRIEDCDPKAISFYRVLAALGAFMTSKMGGHLFRTGTKRDLLTAHSGLDSNFRCARNLARALGDAAEG